MRRAIAGCAASIALAIPAAALAATYDGQVKKDPEAVVELKLRKGAVRSFSVDGLRIKCEGGERPRLGEAKITGVAPISKRGKFSIRGTEGKRSFAVRGKLKGRRTAVGTLRYRGPTRVGDRKLDCDSGKVRWRASR